jgi:hypothetical protein
MNDPHDFNWILVRIVNEEISLVGLYQPEQKRQRSQIGAGSNSQRRFGKQITSQINRFFNFVGGVGIVPRNVSPYIE